MYTDTTTRETTEEEEEAEEEEEEAEEEEAFAEVDCDASITACWTPGHWFAHCMILEQTNTPIYAMPPQCRSMEDVAMDALNSELMRLARDYPRTTCALGVVAATGATIALAKIRTKEGAVVTWVLVSTTTVACAVWMDINL